MGPQYAVLSGKVLWVLSLALLFWAANSVTAGTMLGLSKHKPLVPALLLEGLLNLCLSILWVRGTLGILGVAWGTVIPNFISSLIFWPWYVRRTLQIDPLRYAVSAWVRPGIAILPFAIATFAIEHFLPATNLIVFFSQVACILPLAAIGYWLVCLEPEQRTEYSRRFATLLGRAPAHE